MPPPPPVPPTRCGLSRALSKLGYCSRSEATSLIKMGRVTLNGRVRKDPETPTVVGVDKLLVEGKPVEAVRHVYLMLNKPRGLITTASDDQGRATIFECLQGGGLPPHLSAVGRLDMASEGLLLVTNDNQWATVVTDPAQHVDKVYHVQINRVADEAFIRDMIKGVTTDDGDKLSAKKVTLLRSGPKNCWLEVTLDEGKNRHIRRLVEDLNTEVMRLVRIRVGSLELGPLAKGKWRYLTATEAAKLAQVERAKMR